MGRLWLPATLIGIGIASLVVAPMAQSCVTWSDGRACETGWTIVLNVLGGLLIVSGALWFGLHVMRRPG
jgi:hypothetical protein